MISDEDVKKITDGIKAEIVKNHCLLFLMIMFGPEGMSKWIKQ